MSKAYRFHNGAPLSREIFVFGSNLLGLHEGGAAGHALRHRGAQHGIGQGFMGACYALPTCERPGIPLTLHEVAAGVILFIAYARLARPELTYYVTAVGTGIAGFKHEDIAPLFLSVPDNCILPMEWSGLLTT